MSTQWNKDCYATDIPQIKHNHRKSFSKFNSHMIEKWANIVNQAKWVVQNLKVDGYPLETDVSFTLYFEHEPVKHCERHFLILDVW